MNRHYHPHQVFAYTISGKWGYLEHDWVATAGDFVYESPGEGHTLVAYEHPEPMKVHFNVTGPLIWIDENGDSVGHFDVFDYISSARSTTPRSASARITSSGSTASARCGRS